MTLYPNETESQAIKDRNNLFAIENNLEVRLIFGKCDVQLWHKGNDYHLTEQEEEVLIKMFKEI